MAYTTDENGHYKRTVRCGYCGEVGHNRGSCPTKKQAHLDAVANIEKRIAADDFVDEVDRNWAHRTLERNKEALAKSATRGKNRKCSYCKEGGHTKRTCKFRKEAIAGWTAALTRQQEKYAESMQDYGFGVGTLVEVMYDQAPRLALVTAVDLKPLRHHNDISEMSGYNGSPGLATVSLVKPYEQESWGQKRVKTEGRMQIPLEVHNVMNVPVQVSEYRKQYDGYCNAIISPVDNVKAPVTLNEKEILKIAAELADDHRNSDGACVYEEF